MCEAPVSGSNLGKEDQEQVSSASPETRETFSDDSSVDDFIVDGNEYTPGDVDTSSEGSNFYDLPQPDAMSEEDFLAAGLQQFGSETLPHSTTTKAEALAMMMSFLSANGLSWKALDDLLKMSNTFFAPVSDVFPRSKYLFRKMWASKTVELVDYHYYCKTCNDLLSPCNGEDNLICPTCDKESKAQELKSAGSFFVTMKMHEQLKQVINETKDALQANLERIASSDSSVITDITEGHAHRQLRSSGILGNSDLTVTVNTDGSPVFSSSGVSIWPIQFTVNELPVPLRFQHCTLAGLWFGKEHPDMTLFLAKFVEDMNSMPPVLWEHEGNLHSSKAYVICFCLDAPARSAVQNCVLFNGYFGCPWCLIKGDYIDGSIRYIDFVDAPARTSHGVLRDMGLAVECSVPINGYKGPSPTVNLPHFDLVWGFTVDYMHAVLLGVARQITEQLLSSSSSQERYYIGASSRAAEIDRRLGAIKPPHSFTRLPRPLSTRSNWKASEWRHWLLFYCLPCTLDVLPQQYWSHLKQLVEAIHILLSKVLTQASIDSAEKLLKNFVAGTQRLYGDTAMSFNIHQLLHLPEVARHFGPLWGHSSFVFEGGNGRLVKLVTGASGVPLQIVERVVMQQQLESFLASPLVSDSVTRLCRDMLGYAKLENALHVDDVCLLGYPCQIATPQEVKSALVGQVCPDMSMEYNRLTYKGQILHSTSYKRATRSDSSVVECEDGRYFVITKIISAGSAVYPEAVNSSLINPEAPSYVAVEGDLEAASPAEAVLVAFCF
ncbi:hypothetical protein HPB47_015295 [Ixodes persulcatus]|uniref:Uncharacterized protein n=1 Tax=Ixodes persulcatus TaxID=34615 RepID=A0AC60QTV3_IXOPE|nr:hypothetical protein HPB47_015295 [Ixodes persulcatus]